MTLPSNLKRDPTLPEPATSTAAAPASLPRRHFLHKGAAMAGSAFAAGTMGAGLARGESLAIPEAGKAMGRPIPAKEYGMPSKFEKDYVRVRTNVFVNRQNHSDWSFTPLQYQQGIVTPNGVVYERHHNGTPDIDPDTHKLVIHGMVKQPLVFTMSDLMRYPSVSNSIHGMFGERLDRLDKTGVDHRSANTWIALLWTVGGRAFLDTARRSRRCNGRQVAAGRGRRWRGTHTQHSAQQGDVRWLAGVCAEWRNVPSRKRLSAACVLSRLGRQCQRQMAAPHQGRRPAVAFPQ